MKSLAPVISVVLVQSNEHFVDSVRGLALAIDRYEAIGGQVETILVGRAGDPAAEQLFVQINGAICISSQASSVNEMLIEGLARSTAELIWLGGDQLPSPESIVWLMTAMENGNCVAVCPDSSDAAHMIVRRSEYDPLLRLLQTTYSSSVEIVQSFAAVLKASDKRVAYRLDSRTAVSAGTPVANSPGILGKIVTGEQRNIMIGPHTYSSAGVIIQTWSSAETIVIGDYSMIADQSRILHSRNTGRYLRSMDGTVRVDTPEGGHRPETAMSFPVSYIEPSAFQTSEQEGTVFSAPVIIGCDVWLGYGTIVAGANIGHGAITQPGAVIIQDVPPYAIVGGNPAQVQRFRFSEPVVKKLLEIRWWDWPVETIRSEIEWFRKPINEFVERFG